MKNLNKRKLQKLKRFNAKKFFLLSHQLIDINEEKGMRYTSIIKILSKFIFSKVNNSCILKQFKLIQIKKVKQ